jgi:PRC-barrel domain
MTATPKVLTAAILLAMSASAGAQAGATANPQSPAGPRMQPSGAQQGGEAAPNRAQVQVQQAAPEVTVRQPNPQIIVRQPPPTITIEQAQPEIIVRMPEPDVNVTAARPEVDVRMPKPEVQIQRSQQQADLTVSTSRPQVEFERTGEPRMIYKRAEGKPTVRYERPGEDQPRSAQANAQNQQAAQPSAVADRERQTRERLGIGQPQDPSMAKGTPKAVPVGDLEGMEVRNARNERLGTIDGIFTTPSNNRYVVIAHGGILGMFEKEVALPAARVRLQDDYLLVNGVTEDDLDQMGNFREREANARRMNASDQVRVIVAQQ